MSKVYRTTSRELFHGHHPECAYTVEGDPKACGCEVRLTATPPASRDEPNWRADKTGVCPCGGQCHHGDRIEWCSESCRGAAHRTPHDFIPGPGLFDTPPVCACGADVDDDIHDDLPAEDRDRRLAVLAIEAEARAAALDEARAAVDSAVWMLVMPVDVFRETAALLRDAVAQGHAAHLAAIDALREGDGRP